MSVLTHRVWLFRAMDVLVSAAILISGACYRAPSTAPQPAVVAPSTGEIGFRRFPGIDVVPTGRSGFAIRIHSGMVGDGDPLYVIDGAPMRIPANRGIDWFKPEDIAEIKVLKRPDELAEYGPNGVNGVVVITTKLAAGRSRRH
jgi:hypothetical protein